MRRLFVPLLAALTIPAYCQVAGDAIIQGQMQALATYPAMYLYMNGTDMTGGSTTGYEYRTYLATSQTGTRVNDLINITVYNGSGQYAKPVLSLIGDGATLWRYDMVNNTYSAVKYGNYSGIQPTDYTARLFRSLTSLSDGYMSYNIMLLRQIYGVDGSTYQSWLPGVQPVLDTGGNVTYSIGTPPRRTITFKNTGGALTDVVYDDRASIRGVQHVSDWDIQITPLTKADPTLFVFTPPYGAKPIAGPRLSSN